MKGSEAYFYSEDDIVIYLSVLILTFHDGGRYHIETSPLICRAYQWTGFYMLTAFVMKGLKYLHKITFLLPLLISCRSSYFMPFI